MTGNFNLLSTSSVPVCGVAVVITHNIRDYRVGRAKQSLCEAPVARSTATCFF